MAGTIIVNDNRNWLPAGWLYDAVLEKAAVELSSDPHGLPERLRAATTGVSVGYLDLRPWSHAEVVTFSDAVARVLDNAVRGGAAALHDPKFYDGFVARIGELLSILREEVARRESKGA